MGRSQAQKERTAALERQFKAIDHPDLTNGQIAEKLGVALIWVERARNRLGMAKARPAYKGFKSGLNAEVRKWILDNSPVSALVLAKKYGIHESTATTWLRRMNCLPGHSGKWNRFEHPRGMLGKSHSEDEAKRISERAKRLWADPSHILRSPEMTQRRSDNSVAFQFRNRLAPRFSRSNAGKREDLEGRYFRSTWEANYARYLNFLKANGKIFKWDYEPDTFWFEGIKRGCRFYTPDFKVWETEQSVPYYVEVKGWMDQKSRTKLDRMKRYHPAVQIVLVTATEYKQLKNIARLIPGWEYCNRLKSNS